MSSSEPTPSWDSPDWLIASDTAWQRGLRWQQGWWREVGLKAPVGLDARGDRRVVSMLDATAEASLNLWTEEARVSARHATDLLKLERRPGIIEPDRLRRNLLSSQPLCFNLFGYLRSDPASLLPWVRTIAPTADQITRVELEWAPREGTIGGSAFDAFVEYATPGGPGFLGIEVKYAESLKASQTKPAKQGFVDATATDRWMPGAAVQLDVTGLRQFWYNALLVQAVLDQGYREGHFVVVACEQDLPAASALFAIRDQLASPANCAFSSLQDVVAAVSGHDEWRQTFTRRYLDFSPIRDLLPEGDLRR